MSLGGEEGSDAPRSGRRRFWLTAGGIAVVLAIVAGAAVVWSSSRSEPTASTSTATPSSGATRSASASPTATTTPSPTPEPSASATPQPATAEPVPAGAPDPFVTSVPAGTVVAEGDVVSPKGSIRFHYRMVANGDDTYTADYSGFTSTLPVPVGVTLKELAPSVGDGLADHGTGDLQLGGPTSGTALASSASLGGVGQPSYLLALVTYSAAASDPDLPVEIGPDKVLAVEDLRWDIPERQSNITPVDAGARDFAVGTVPTTTATGGPRAYLVAPGDLLGEVAGRFGISPAALIYLNKNLMVLGDQQYLLEGTIINLDPNEI